MKLRLNLGLVIFFPTADLKKFISRNVIQQIKKASPYCKQDPQKDSGRKGRIPVYLFKLLVDPIWRIYLHMVHTAHTEACVWPVYPDYTLYTLTIPCIPWLGLERRMACIPLAAVRRHVHIWQQSLLSCLVTSYHHSNTCLTYWQIAVTGAHIRTRVVDPLCNSKKVYHLKDSIPYSKLIGLSSNWQPRIPYNTALLWNWPENALP